MSFSVDNEYLGISLTSSQFPSRKIFRGGQQWWFCCI